MGGTGLTRAGGLAGHYYRPAAHPPFPFPLADYPTISTQAAGLYLSVGKAASGFTAAAAIDRVVHHSVILEFDVPSYRTDAASNAARLLRPRR